MREKQYNKEGKTPGIFQASQDHCVWTNGPHNVACYFIQINSE